MTTPATTPRSQRLWAIGLLGIALVFPLGSGCATRITNESALSSDELPRPDRVYVGEFHVLPANVVLDSAPGAEVERALESVPSDELREKVGDLAARTIAEELVKDIRGLGLDAEAGHDVLPPPNGEVLLSIQGQLLSVDEGNRLRRLAIGLGAGRSTVLSAVQIYLLDDRGERLVERFDVTSKSPPLPGLAETMGVGAATGRLAVSASVSAGTHLSGEIDQKLGQTVRADALRAADAVSKRLAELFREEGWLTP